MKKTGIVVIGSVFVDIKGYPLSQYIPAGRNVGRVVQVHGGVCRNVAEDIANMELRPTFVSLVDDTGTGIDVVQKLKRHQVNTDYIRTVEDGMGTWLAVFSNDGDVVASISKRPDLSPIGDIIDQYGDEMIEGCDSIAVEIDMEPWILKKIFRLAEKYEKDIYAVVSNMSIAMERRDLIKKTACLVCNQEEAGILFSDNYEETSPEEMEKIIMQKVQFSQIPRIIITMGSQGAVFASKSGEHGHVAAKKVDVIDTTGAGDAFFAGVTSGLTYGKSLHEACEIGTRLSASVIVTKESVCPRFMPEEFGLPQQVRD